MFFIFNYNYIACCCGKTAFIAVYVDIGCINGAEGVDVLFG